LRGILLYRITALLCFVFLCLLDEKKTARANMNASTERFPGEEQIYLPNNQYKKLRVEERLPTPKEQPEPSFDSSFAGTVQRSSFAEQVALQPELGADRYRKMIFVIGVVGLLYLALRN